VISKQRSQCVRVQSHTQIWNKNIPGKENSKHKDQEPDELNSIQEQQVYCDRTERVKQRNGL
jgi:hypothetical protein